MFIVSNQLRVVSIAHKQRLCGVKVVRGARQDVAARLLSVFCLPFSALSRSPGRLINEVSCFSSVPFYGMFNLVVKSWIFERQKQQNIEKSQQVFPV